MEYAIIDNDNRLHSVITISQGEKVYWSGPENEYKMLVGESFNIDQNNEFADYRWDGDNFIYDPQL